MFHPGNNFITTTNKASEIYSGHIGDDSYISMSNDNYNAKRHLIKEFYKDAAIFVTGGTGFIGKVLIEKLLRTCDTIRCVYVLLRPKRGMSSDRRYADLIQNPIFDRLRASDPQKLKKLICICGDISQPLLGLNIVDLEKLIDNVTIVFHSAATVRFNQNIKQAANMNVMGTHRLWELCTKMNKLKSVVHVSTAYSNPNKREVEERVYPPKLQMDIDTFIKCASVLPDDVVSKIASSLQGPHPNTYTVTKSMAEQIAADYHHKLPICIVRPSIVTAAVDEPYPGWVDNINGITGIIMEISRGTISSIMADKNLIMDLIPVDIVSNTMITAAWMNYIKPSNSLRVYNCISGQINPVIWNEFGNSTLKYSRENPTKYVMLYPNFTYRKNYFIHRFYELFFHFLPAILYDIILRMQGNRPILYSIAKRYKAAADTGKFFAMHEWIFETTNIKELVKEVADAKDGNEFNCDVRSFKWDEYIKSYMLGIRKYVLKDELKSMKRARASVKRLYATKCILQMFFLYLIYFCFKEILSIWFST